MAKQQVFRLPQRNSIHDLQVCQEDVPTPSSNEVLIKIKNVALNFRDFAVATGKYPFPVKDNVIPGSDLSGEVVSVGSHVDDFIAGDKVISSFDLKTLYGAMPDWFHSLGGCYDGVLRQYITLPSPAIVKVSSDSQLDFAQLSALVCTGTTAWNALYGNVPLKPGQTVLLLGRSSSYICIHSTDRYIKGPGVFPSLVLSSRKRRARKPSSLPLPTKSSHKSKRRTAPITPSIIRPYPTGPRRFSGLQTIKALIIFSRTEALERLRRVLMQWLMAATSLSSGFLQAALKTRCQM